MRTLIGFLVGLAIAAPSAVQTALRGDWKGVMQMPGRQIRIVLHVSRVNGILTATVGSPNPHAHAMQVDRITLNGPTLEFTLAKPAIRYEGTVSDGAITGTFVQQGMRLPLSFRREVLGSASKLASRRPGDVVGTWGGILAPPPPKLHFELYVRDRNGQLAATADSPDQGIYGMYASSIGLTGRTVRFSLAGLGDYRGVISNGKISGGLVQQGRTLPLILVRAPAGAFSPRTSSGLIVASSRKTAPDFTLRDSRGAMLSLSGFAGKVVLLDFWATWCHGCRTEIPWYEQFASEDKKTGLAVVGVSMDNGWKAVKPFMLQEKMNYPVVIGSDSLLSRYGIRALPATFLIDRNGKIADLHAGVVVNKEALERELTALLREGAATAAN
ncbi:MAG TPA: TlpA disulfide reductase family protein [Terriglobia bacterium]|nr:TlpA disulfide reductase family protein [Terriglobia bacterium]